MLLCFLRSFVDDCWTRRTARHRLSGGAAELDIVFRVIVRDDGMAVSTFFNFVNSLSPSLHLASLYTYTYLVEAYSPLLWYVGGSAGDRVMRRFGAGFL